MLLWRCELFYQIMIVPPCSKWKWSYLGRNFANTLIRWKLGTVISTPHLDAALLDHLLLNSSNLCPDIPRNDRDNCPSLSFLIVLRQNKKSLSMVFSKRASDVSRPVSVRVFLDPSLCHNSRSSVLFIIFNLCITGNSETPLSNTAIIWPLCPTPVSLPSSFARSQRISWMIPWWARPVKTTSGTPSSLIWMLETKLVPWRTSPCGLAISFRTRRCNGRFKSGETWTGTALEKSQFCLRYQWWHSNSCYQLKLCRPLLA